MQKYKYDNNINITFDEVEYKIRDTSTESSIQIEFTSKVTRNMISFRLYPAGNNTKLQFGFKIAGGSWSDWIIA